MRCRLLSSPAGIYFNQKIPVPISTLFIVTFISPYFHLNSHKKPSFLFSSVSFHCYLLYFFTSHMEILFPMQFSFSVYSFFFYWFSFLLAVSLPLSLLQVSTKTCFSLTLWRYMLLLVTESPCNFSFCNSEVTFMVMDLQSTLLFT